MRDRQIENVILEGTPGLLLFFAKNKNNTIINVFSFTTYLHTNNIKWDRETGREKERVRDREREKEKERDDDRKKLINKDNTMFKISTQCLIMLPTKTERVVRMPGFNFLMWIIAILWWEFSPHSHTRQNKPCLCYVCCLQRRLLK